MPRDARSHQHLQVGLVIAIQKFDPNSSLRWKSPTGTSIRASLETQAQGRALEQHLASTLGSEIWRADNQQSTTLGDKPLLAEFHLFNMNILSAREPFASKPFGPLSAPPDWLRHEKGTVAPKLLDATPSRIKPIAESAWFFERDCDGNRYCKSAFVNLPSSWFAAIVSHRVRSQVLNSKERVRNIVYELKYE